MTLAFDTVRREYLCQDVVARYCPDLRLQGRIYRCLCPFHDDKRPTNFNVYNAPDGIQRWRCFACGEHGDVIDFVAKIEKCSAAEAIERITGEKLPHVGDFKRPKLPPSQSDAWKPIMPVPLDAEPYNPKFTINPHDGKSKDYTYGLERQDAYRDENGQLLFFVLRRRFPDGGKFCPVISYCEGPKGVRKWCAKRPKPPLPLMGLDDLARWPHKPVIIVEGEKCKSEFDRECPPFSEKHHKAGQPRFVVVTWVGGTDNVNNVDWSPLLNRQVIFYEDDDDPGRRAMVRINEVIQGLIEKSGTG